MFDDMGSYLILSTVALRNLDNKNLPTQGIASGCLIDYSGKRFILTVAHATQKGGKWGIEVKYEPENGTQVYSIGTMNFLKEFNINQLSSKDIDFSYAIVPNDLEPLYQEVQPPYNTVTRECKKVIHTIDFDIIPDNEKTYGFFGLTRSSLENGRFISEQSLVMGMKFSKRIDEYYEFVLSENHKGDEFYRGCSGAPILDNEGNVVALVTSGCESKNTIYGISLNRYKIALDIEAESMD